MSRKNAVKIETKVSESSGYHFKSSSDDSSYVIASKHGLCLESEDCTEFNEGVDDCCKKCNITINIADIKLTKKDNRKLTPLKSFGFSDSDIAVVQVAERSYTPLKLGKLKNESGEFVAFGYKAKDIAPSRLLLNEPELDCGQCYFNIESNPITELVEKSDDYYGVSGALVIDRRSMDIPVAYSVITTNEKSNDLAGESLYDSNLHELNDFFGTELFAAQKKEVEVDKSFKEHFSQIDYIPITESLCISVLVPKYNGYPYFNLMPIAKSLIDEFEAVLGHVAENKSMLTVSALRVLEQHKELQPAYKLLSSRVVESMMDAPHIYSTYIDHSHYHHVHLLNNSEKGAEFIISSFGGEGSLTVELNHAISQMLYNIHHYSFNAKLISERAFLDVKYSPEECEFLYEVLFGDHDDFIENLSIIYCINIQSLTESDDISIEEQIKAVVQQAISNLDSDIVRSIGRGLKVSLYVMPMNGANELTELVERLLK